MTERKSVARWRKQPDETGLRKVCQATRGADLICDGERLIHVRPKDRTGSTGWYWYGIGRNTAAQSVPTIEQAKDEAMTFYREHACQQAPAALTAAKEG